ncbi:MAG: glycoside hydrolase family 43 protein [Saprospiraceae bacterium]
MLVACGVQSQSYTNPVLRGSYPDPSICRAGDTFYMANSSFEYFPGLPIHRSTDLVNWELVGYGLHRPEQVSGEVNLRDVQSDGGIHAPSLRYHDGTFYLITTNVYHHPETGVTDFVNFVLTAATPSGPWSEPHIIEGAPGIDPDLFFDEDGSVWYVGNQMPENPNFEGEGEIWIQRLDLESWRLIGERSLLWRGACGGVWAEGPHLYKIMGLYYLMIAEGGTSFNHAVMIACSEDIRGPYVPNDRNPILTSRHVSYDHWVNSTGHGDLIEIADGRWYMVALGIRGEVNRRSNMGRETLLLPVSWEYEPYEWKSPRYWWPVVSPATGKAEASYLLPFPGQPQRLQHTVFEDHFTSAVLHPEWNFRRVPAAGTWALHPERGALRLFALPTTPQDRGRAALVGIRQQETAFNFSAEFTFEHLRSGAEAGIGVVQKDNAWFLLTIARVDSGAEIHLTRHLPGTPDELVYSSPIYQSDSVQLSIEATKSGYTCILMEKDGTPRILCTLPSDILLSRGYTGAYLMLYCSGKGQENGGYAEFTRVRRESIPGGLRDTLIQSER